MSGKEFLGSIAISFIAIGVIILFVLPFLYPAMQTDIEDEGIVLQTKYKEFLSTAQILDDNTGSYILVPDTELNITVQNNSKLAVIFSGRYSLGLSDELSTGDKVAFNITLSVFDSLNVLVGNRTARISYKTDEPIGTTILEISGIFYLDYLTSPLSAGTYTVSLSWISLYNRSGTTYFLFTTPLANFPRSIRLIEYKS